MVDKEKSNACYHEDEVHLSMLRLKSWISSTESALKESVIDIGIINIHFIEDLGVCEHKEGDNGVK